MVITFEAKAIANGKVDALCRLRDTRWYERQGMTMLDKTAMCLSIVL